MMRASHSRALVGFLRNAAGSKGTKGVATNYFRQEFSCITFHTSGYWDPKAKDQAFSFASPALPYGHFFDKTSSSVHKRFRSALPDDYSDDDEDEHDGKSTNASSSSTATPFLLADIGEGIAEVELLRWFVKEGQSINEFDPVCEVQSDKATVEITSRFEGEVHKLAFESTGSMIKVGEPILWIRQNNLHESYQIGEGEEQEDEAVTATAATRLSPPSTAIDESSSPKSVQEIPFRAAGIREQDAVGSSASNRTDKILTSPAVRKLARDHTLDLSSVIGTGPSGRITKGDVLAILKDSPSTNSSVTIKPLEESITTLTTGATTTGIADGTHSSLEENTVVPLKGYNRIMADTMTASLQIPHMVYSDEINLNRFVRYKTEQAENDVDKKLIFLPLAIKAASKALEDYPWLNASFDGNQHDVTLYKDHNIGIAMDTPRGLLVPVLKQCQHKSLPEIADELKRLKDAACCESGGLPMEDLSGATFTLSNVGAIGGGGTYMSPIITPPQVAIGALGQIRRLPRFVNGSSEVVEQAHICTVSWAADHRVVDGATVARFHKVWKSYMEDPVRLLLELR